MFVGGTFSSRVWNGQDFVTIVDVAQFVGDKQVSHTGSHIMHMIHASVCVCMHVYMHMCVSMLGSGVLIKALETFVPVHCDAWSCLRGTFMPEHDWYIHIGQKAGHGHFRSTLLLFCASCGCH